MLQKLDECKEFLEARDYKVLYGTLSNDFRNDGTLTIKNGFSTKSIVRLCFYMKVMKLRCKLLQPGYRIRTGTYQFKVYQ